MTEVVHLRSDLSKGVGQISVYDTSLLRTYEDMICQCLVRRV
jgi:hypothetical protein